jgi:outer membrane murein-binding lipoprotein Lpp
MSPRTNPIVRDLFRTLALVAACIVAAHLLAGCGGGNPKPDVLTTNVSCMAGVCK